MILDIYFLPSLSTVGHLGAQGPSHRLQLPHSNGNPLPKDHGQGKGRGAKDQRVYILKRYLSNIANEKSREDIQWIAYS